MRPPFPLMNRRLLLRPLAASDVECVVRYRRHPEVRRFQSWGAERDQVVALAARQAKDPLEPGCWFQLAVVLRETHQLVGDMGLRPLGPLEPSTAELGITIDPAFQRQGLGREATRLLTVGARELLHFSRIRAHTEPDNLACIALLEGLGFVRVRAASPPPEADPRSVDERIYELGASTPPRTSGGTRVR
jgi:RimJ/RimL family protein N-acetyltransferase